MQTNSATAEESAAASEELSSQAEMLKGMVEKFQLDSAKTLTEDTHNYSIHEKDEENLNTSLSEPQIMLSDDNFGKY